MSETASGGDAVKGNPQKSLTCLTQMLEGAIKHFKCHSERHKRNHRRCQNAVIVLSAFTSIVAGLGLVIADDFIRKWIQFGVLCLTTTTAAIATWSEMRQTRALWQHERKIYHALRDIERDAKFAESTPTFGDKDVAGLYERFDTVLTSSFDDWGRLQTSTTTNTGGQTQVTLGGR